MELSTIDKAQYRQRLNWVIGGFIATFLALSLFFGWLLITWFGDAQASNFKFNFLGVVLGLLACAAILHQLRNTEFFQEVRLVFDMKQSLNKIYRKLNKVKAKAKEGDQQALVILNYYYQNYKIIYHLDDNTLTMPEFERDHQTFIDIANEFDVTLDSHEYQEAWLKNY